MKLITHALLLSMILGPVARAEDPPLPPPPPNPFSNLPSGGSEGFTPFDDDFDDGGGFDTGSDPGTAFMNRDSGKATGSGSKPPANTGRPTPSSGGTVSAEGGKSQRLAPPASCKEVVENFDYPDAEILDVAKAIAKLTAKNFIYNPQDIKGRISVVSQNQITVCDAWNAFLTALNLKGFALVPSGKYLRIERIANAKEKQTPIYSDKKAPSNDEFITRVIPLRYIDATEFESAFRLWMPREARMQAYGQTNTIIITDTAAHINRMLELIQLLDVAGYQESLVVIPIRNAAAKDIAKLIENILNEGRGASSGGGFGMPPRPGGSYGAPARSTRGRTGSSTISKIIADDRTNSIIVKANAAGILEIRALTRRLDTKVAAADGSGRIHVVTLRFANAEDMAKTLSSLTSGGGAKSTRNTGFPTFGEAPAAFTSEIKVSADKPTQSLVIMASPQDFITMKKVIERLDQPRDQVYIEAMILELNITRNTAYGTSFINASNGVMLDSASGNLQKVLQGLPATGFVLGFKQGPDRAPIKVGDKTFNTNSLNGLLEFVQANTDSQVIATPQIIALDNEKATFEVSEQIPVPKTTVPANGVPVQSFEPDKAELRLEVTPQINKGSNYVKLEILQKLENFDPTGVPSELAGKTFAKNTRATTTKVFVQSEDTVVLSGMIRSKVTEVVSKVPLLGDIPVLGWLFKNSKTDNTRTNLLVFITPRIIKQYDKIRKILASKLEERDEFVRETQGSIDPFGREVNKLKKGLPDLTVIEPLPQAKTHESSSFQGPSEPSRDDEQDYYDQNNFYDPYGNGSIPLQPIEPMPGGGAEFQGGGDGSPPPVVTPQFDGSGGITQ